MSQDFNCQEALLKCKATEDITGKDGLAQKIIKFLKKTAAEIKFRAMDQQRKTSRPLMETLTSKYHAQGSQALSRKLSKKEPSLMKGWNHRPYPCMPKGCLCVILRNTCRHYTALSCPQHRFQILQTKSPRRQRTGTAGRWTAFTRLYSLMPCILKYVKKGGS